MEEKELRRNKHQLILYIQQTPSKDVGGYDVLFAEYAVIVDGRLNGVHFRGYTQGRR